MLLMFYLILPVLPKSATLLPPAPVFELPQAVCPLRPLMPVPLICTVIRKGSVSVTSLFLFLFFIFLSFQKPAFFKGLCQ